MCTNYIIYGFIIVFIAGKCQYKFDKNMSSKWRECVVV